MRLDELGGGDVVRVFEGGPGLDENESPLLDVVRGLSWSLLLSEGQVSGAHATKVALTSRGKGIIYGEAGFDAVLAIGIVDQEAERGTVGSRSNLLDNLWCFRADEAKFERVDRTEQQVISKTTEKAHDGEKICCSGVPAQRLGRRRHGRGVCRGSAVAISGFGLNPD